MVLSTIIQELKELGDSAIAAHSQKFFKAFPGGYGEGDRFLGIRVPVLRQVAKRHSGLPLSQILTLLRSEYHEVRLLALIMLVNRFKRADESEQATIYHSYLEHSRFVNNWDLVDASAPYIAGGYLYPRDRDDLYRLVRSPLLWERRIAIMATFYFIRKNDFSDTLRLAELLLGDSHDLIHKAVGWMLREVGKRDKNLEWAFLEKHHRQMPRTMLRYAIERFTPEERKKILNSEL